MVCTLTHAQGVLDRVWMTGAQLMCEQDADVAATTWDFDPVKLDFGSGPPVWMQLADPTLPPNFMILTTAMAEAVDPPSDADEDSGHSTHGMVTGTGPVGVGAGARSAEAASVHTEGGPVVVDGYPQQQRRRAGAGGGGMWVWVGLCERDRQALCSQEGGSLAVVA